VKLMCRSNQQGAGSSVREEGGVVQLGISDHLVATIREDSWV
jgi:hypothetical protein